VERTLDSRSHDGKIGASTMAESKEYSNGSADAEVDVEVQHERVPKRASRYRVVLYNDDYTTMEFVVLVLMEFFGKTETDATRVMLEVHHKGQGVAGTYVRDIAETKAEMVQAHARAHGHPLKCTAEPSGETVGTSE
jgi:ATP-dependent Clp protease adaptor protein ClpS